MSAAGDRAPFNIVRRTHQINQGCKATIKKGCTNKYFRSKGPTGIAGGRAEILFAFHFLKPLRFVLGLPKWKLYAAEGSPYHCKLLTGPFSLDPPLQTSDRDKTVLFTSGHLPTRPKEASAGFLVKPTLRVTPRQSVTNQQPDLRNTTLLGQLSIICDTATVTIQMGCVLHDQMLFSYF